MKITSRFTSNTVGVGRKLSRTAFLVIVGIFMLLSGLLITSMNEDAKNYIDVDATIIEITDENEVYVEYLVGRNIYKAKSNTYSSTYKVGDVIQVSYDPENPDVVIEKNGWMGLLFAGIGIAMIVYGVFITVRYKKKREIFEAVANGEALPTEEYNRYIPSVDIADIFPGFRPDTNDSIPRDEYYFHYSGKLGQGHLLETPDRKPVYEAVLRKFSLLGNCDYDFIDYKTGRSTPHKIGKTVTINADSSFADSGFKFDGEDIFDIIHAGGYTIDMNVLNALMKVEYTVLYQGREIGTILTAGTEVVPGVKSTKLTQNLIADGLFKVYCSEDNIPIMFFITLAFARTETRIHE